MQVEKLLRRTFPKMIEIEMDLSDDLADISADPTQVEQVLMNLSVNARDAMPDGAGSPLGQETSRSMRNTAGVHVGAKPGEYVLMLSVSDTGHGIRRKPLNTYLSRSTQPRKWAEELGLALRWYMELSSSMAATSLATVKLGTEQLSIFISQQLRAKWSQKSRAAVNACIRKRNHSPCR